MNEIISIDSKYGFLEIKGGTYDSVLLLNGELIQFTFLREIGSTWRYQIAKGINESDIVREQNFSNFVKYGFLSFESLSCQFEYILKCLVSGKYQIELTKLDSAIGVVEINENVNGYFNYDTYGGMPEIIETQSTCNEELIKEYITLIQNGNEPIMILLKSKNSENTFIIDGHHKFCAYSHLKKEAKCLLITRLDSPELSKEEGLRLIAQTNLKNIEYKNQFLARLT